MKEIKDSYLKIRYIGHSLRDFGISNDGTVFIITDDKEIIRFRIAKIEKKED